jgi:hypothetical protein
MNRDLFELKQRYLGYSQTVPPRTEQDLPHPVSASGTERGGDGGDGGVFALSEAGHEKRGDL